MRRRFGLLLLLLLPVARPAAGQAQARAGTVGPDTATLAAAAGTARAAWVEHAAARLVADAPRVVVQLPGADPSTALGREQAAALLDDYLSGATEVDVAMRAAREVEPGRGYVELERRFRVAGTQEVRVQTILLGYRLVRGSWRLVELRVVE